MALCRVVCKRPWPLFWKNWISASNDCQQWQEDHPRRKERSEFFYDSHTMREWVRAKHRLNCVYYNSTAHTSKPEQTKGWQQKKKANDESMFENISHFLFSCTRVANQTDNKWDVLSWKSFALTIELVVWVCGFAKDFHAVDDAMMLRCWKFEMILSLFALVSLPLALWKWKILVGVASMRKSQMRKDEKKISKFSQWKIHSLHSLFCVVFRIIKVFSYLFCELVIWNNWS